MSKLKKLSKPAKTTSGMIAAALIAALVSSGAVSAAPYVYPNKGQNQEKMESDKYGCYQWAKSQTGVDPMQAAPPSKRSGLRGAAGGAAMGAAVGAIAGNAGKGAAIGAAGGGLIGGAKKRQQEKAHSASRSEYDRAWGACMEGKGYTVK